MSIQLTPISLPTGGYIDIVEAGDFAYRVADVTAWTNATDEIKAAALVQASDEIDTLVFMGSPLEATQARAFPRFVADVPYDWPNDKKYASGMIIDTDDDGNAIIPMHVKLATFLQALCILRDTTRVNRLRDRHDGIASQGAAGFNESYDTGKPVDIICMEAMQQLKRYTLKAGNMYS